MSNCHMYLTGRQIAMILVMASSFGCSQGPTPPVSVSQSSVNTTHQSSTPSANWTRGDLVGTWRREDATHVIRLTFNEDGSAILVSEQKGTGLDGLAKLVGNTYFKPEIACTWTVNGRKLTLEVLGHVDDTSRIGKGLQNLVLGEQSGSKVIAANIDKLDSTSLVLGDMEMVRVK